MGAAAVAVKILVDVVDEVGHRAVRVLDVLEVGAGVLGKRASGGVVGAWEEDQLRRGAGVADGGDGGLDGVGPGGHIGDLGDISRVRRLVWEYEDLLS